MYRDLKSNNFEFHWLIDNPNLKREHFDFVDKNDIFFAQKNMGKFSLVANHVTNNNVKTRFFKTCDPDDFLYLEKLINFKFPDEDCIIRTKFYQINANEVNESLFKNPELYFKNKSTHKKRANSTCNTILPTKAFLGSYKLDYKNVYFNIFEDQLLALICHFNGFYIRETNQSFYVYLHHNGISSFENFVNFHYDEAIRFLKFWISEIEKYKIYPPTVSMHWYTKHFRKIADKLMISGSISEEKNNILQEEFKFYENIIYKYDLDFKNIKSWINPDIPWQLRGYYKEIDENFVSIYSSRPLLIDSDLYILINWILNNTKYRVNYYSDSGETSDSIENLFNNDKNLFVHDRYGSFLSSYSMSKYLFTDSGFPFSFPKKCNQILIIIKGLDLFYKQEDLNFDRNVNIADFILLHDSYDKKVISKHYSISEDQILMFNFSKMKTVKPKSNYGQVLFLYNYQNKRISKTALNSIAKEIVKVDQFIFNNLLFLNNRFRISLSPNLYKEFEKKDKLTELLTFNLNLKSDFETNILASDKIISNFRFDESLVNVSRTEIFYTDKLFGNELDITFNEIQNWSKSDCVQDGTYFKLPKNLITKSQNDTFNILINNDFYDMHNIPKLESLFFKKMNHRKLSLLIIGKSKDLTKLDIGKKFDWIIMDDRIRLKNQQYFSSIKKVKFSNLLRLTLKGKIYDNSSNPYDKKIVEDIISYEMARIFNKNKFELEISYFKNKELHSFNN